MNIVVDASAPVHRMGADANGGGYASQVVLCIGSPVMRYRIEIRDLIHFTAYRLDTGDGGMIVNHRAAVALRSIAEAFYPYHEDEADYFVEDLETEGFDVEFDFASLPVSHFDVRLLGLIDGMVCVHETFDEPVFFGEERHVVLGHNESSFVDFVFPEQVLQLTGIRGLRIYELDLLCWLKEGADRRALAFEENQDVWLDELADAERRAANVAARYSEERARLREKQRPSTSSNPVAIPPEVDLDEMLEEISAMIEDMAA